MCLTCITALHAHVDCLCDDILSEALLCQAFDKKSEWNYGAYTPYAVQATR